MTKLKRVIILIIDINFIIGFVAIHLLFTIFTGASEVQWFITLNNTKQIQFLDTYFMILMIIEFISLILKLEEWIK